MVQKGCTVCVSVSDVIECMFLGTGQLERFSALPPIAHFLYKIGMINICA